MLTYQSVNRLKVAELREKLEERGLYTVGLKSVLVDRLIQWDEYYEQQLQHEESKSENELRAELARWGRSTEGTKPILVRRLVKENNERERQLEVQRSFFRYCGLLPSNNNDAAPETDETPGAESAGPGSSNAVTTPLQKLSSDNQVSAPAAENLVPDPSSTIAGKESIPVLSVSAGAAASPDLRQQKVKIVRALDGQNYVRGLLPGQRLQTMPDGRIHILNANTAFTSGPTEESNKVTSPAPAAESENSEMAQVVEQPQEQSQSPAKRARSASLEDFTAHQLLTDVRNSGLFPDEDIIKEFSRRDGEIKRMGMLIEKKKQNNQTSK